MTRGSIRRQPNGKYLPRVRTPDGREISKSFNRKADAQRWLTEQIAAMDAGTHIDHRGGRTDFRTYADAWLAMQVVRSGTAAKYETALRLGVYPRIGHRPLAAIRPSEVQSMVAWMGTSLEWAPNTVRVALAVTSSVFKAAIMDRRIAANPCQGVKLPEVHKARVEPMTTDQVLALHEAMAPPWRAAITLGAGTGLRQGEMFAVTVDRVDFLRRRLRVDRQMIAVAGGPPRLAPPKTRASVRSIPLPQVVVDALAAHLREHGSHGTDGLLFRPIHRATFSKSVWRPARKAAGLPASVTFHDLRHFYASLLIRHGESVKTVQARLGHSSAVMTLDTYSHLWPDSDDLTRAAVDDVLGGSVDYPRTGLGAAE
jgi:integrase